MGVVWLPLLILCASMTGRAEHPASPDSLSSQLKEIVVEGRTPPAVRLSETGDLKVSLSALQRGVRVMGEADVLSILKRSGGISSAGDYGSGVIIQGNAPWQSMFRINRAPVYFPYRFGGIFSTFNTPHFRSAEVSKYCRDGSMPDRLGAVVDLYPALQYSRPISLSANVGLLSSSLTARLAACRRVALTISGRLSYIDELYGRLIKTDRNALSYRFNDINISAGWKIDSLNTLTADFFTNSDKIFAGNANYAMQTDLSWRNLVGSLTWTSAGEHPAEATAFYSGIGSKLIVAFPQYDVTAPNSLHSLGVSAKVRLLNGQEFVPTVTAGAEFGAWLITPLHASLHGELERSGARKTEQRPLGGRIYADARFSPLEYLSFGIGLSASCFGRFLTADPRADIEVRHRGNTWRIGVGRYSQFLHNVGFSDIGLASNFWYASTPEIKPQHSTDITATWTKSFLAEEIMVSVAAYYKAVSSQSEYYGTVLDVIDSDYDAAQHIRTADGFNAGIEAGIQKTFGALTGGINYSFGRAMRHSEGCTFRAKSDIGHQLKADAEYAINSHWTLSAAFTFASGRVYTPTKYLYIIANRIITEYAAPNSGRLPDYQRLDIAASYRFTTGGKLPMSHMLNLSLINAYGHDNIEGQYFSVNTETMQYELIRTRSLYRFLPSISYSIEF